MSEDRKRARAVARALALNARQALNAGERELREAGDDATADVFREANREVTSGPITAAYDGEAEVFACER